MDRRTFLKSSGLATVGLTATSSLAGTALAESANVLDLTISETTAPFDAALVARRLSEHLEMATSKRIQIAAAPDHETSQADLTLASVAYMVGKHPAFAAFLPTVHGLSAQGFEQWMAIGGGAPLLDELGHESGEKFFLIGTQPAPTGLWTDQTVSALPASADLTFADDGSTLSIHGATNNMQISLILADAEAGQNNQTRHALPNDMAGQPVFLAVTNTAWTSMSHADRTIFAALAAAEQSRATTEMAARSAMIAAQAPNRPMVPLPVSLDTLYRSKIEQIRRDAERTGTLGAQLIGSQRAFANLTRSDKPAQSQDPAIS